jgi:uncharacterized protein
MVKLATFYDPDGNALMARPAAEVRELVSYTVVLLRRSADAPDLPEEELDAIQEQHIAFLQGQRDAGSMLASGPFRDQPDESLRGLCVHAVPVEEASAIAARDPAVVAGRMAAEAFTWLMPPGLARFGPGA